MKLINKIKAVGEFLYDYSFLISISALALLTLVALVIKFVRG